MRELVYYVAVTLDGYIAGPDGQFDDFLVEGDHMAVGIDQYADAIPTDLAAQLGIEQTRARFDTVLMGANTYAVGLPDNPNPFRHLTQFVFTSRPYEDAENLTFTDEDPVELVRALKEQPGGDLWLSGGGQLATRLAGEIDRLVLKRQPLLFGSGVPLFAPRPYAVTRFDRVAHQDFGSGVSFTEYVPRR